MSQTSSAINRAYVIYKDPEHVPQRYFDRVGHAEAGHRVQVRRRPEKETKP